MPAGWCRSGPTTPPTTCERRWWPKAPSCCSSELRDGLSTPVPQVGEATYAAKIDPAELQLDWTQPATHLDRVVRVGRAWTTFRGARLRLLRARMLAESSLGSGELDGVVVGAGRGALEMLEVQPEAKAPMGARAWVNGARPQPGERLGS